MGSLPWGNITESGRSLLLVLLRGPAHWGPSLRRVLLSADGLEPRSPGRNSGAQAGQVPGKRWPQQILQTFFTHVIVVGEETKHFTALRKPVTDLMD